MATELLGGASRPSGQQRVALKQAVEPLPGRRRSEQPRGAAYGQRGFAPAAAPADAMTRRQLLCHLRGKLGSFHDRGHLPELPSSDVAEDQAKPTATSRSKRLRRPDRSGRQLVLERLAGRHPLRMVVGPEVDRMQRKVVRTTEAPRNRRLPRALSAANPNHRRPRASPQRHPTQNTSREAMPARTAKEDSPNSGGATCSSPISRRAASSALSRRRPSARSCALACSRVRRQRQLSGRKGACRIA